MTQAFTIKLLVGITVLLSTIAGYTTYRWRQEVAREQRIEEFYKQVEQKRKADKALLDRNGDWGDGLKKHHIN